jgi:hypothetical protein
MALAYFEKACAHLKRDQSYSMLRQFTFRLGWQDGYLAEIIETNWQTKKVNYIQQL